MVKMRRRNFWHSQLFKVRKGKPAWPTIRGFYITEEAYKDLRLIASLHFTTGEYLTNLNPPGVSPLERIAQFEARARVLPLTFDPESPRGETLYANIWLTNYAHGCIFNGAWQFPHLLQFDPVSMEFSMFWIYVRCVNILARHNPKQVLDPEVEEFITLGQKIHRSRNTSHAPPKVRDMLIQLYGEKNE